MFMMIEDETGCIDLIVRPSVYERYRNAAVYGSVVSVSGRVERRGCVLHILARRIDDIQGGMTPLPHLSRDFQ